MRAAGSEAVAAIEYAYHLVQFRHPELPPVRDVLCLAELPGAAPMSAWMQEPARQGDRYVLVLTTQTLSHPRHALYMVLHEATHMLCHVRGVRDVRKSERGYHTACFKEVALELGLRARRSPTQPKYGWAFTEPLPSANLDVVYADAITRFDLLKGTK